MNATGGDVHGGSGASCTSGGSTGRGSRLWLFFAL